VWSGVDGTEQDNEECWVERSAGERGLRGVCQDEGLRGVCQVTGMFVEGTGLQGNRVLKQEHGESWEHGTG
jgi:hypothetical protein